MPPSPSTTRFDLPAGLAPFSAPLQDFRNSYDPDTRLVIGAFIFTTAPPSPIASPSSNPSITTQTTRTTEPQILILHRATSDVFGDKWDFPGGSVEVSQDSSILDAVAREVWEETGLRVKTVLEYVGMHTWEDTLKNGEVERWAKWGFWVEVEDADEGESKEGRLEGRPTIRLAETEHQDFRWVGQEVIEQSLVGGEGGLEFIAIEEMEVAAEAFKRFKRHLEVAGRK